MKTFDWNKIAELVCRLYVFIFLNFYGFGKILGGQFYRKGQLPEEVANTLIGQATAYELAWSFMGYSFFYILFIGSSQIIGAWLLLWDRTKLLGVTILIPILLNIIVFDIIFLDILDALVNATLYFFMLLYILYFNRVKVKLAFKALTTLVSAKKSKKLKNIQAFKRMITVLLLMALVFGIDQFFVTLVRNLY